MANAVTSYTSGNLIMSSYLFASMSSPNAEDQSKRTYTKSSSHWRFLATPSVHSALSAIPLHLSRSPLCSSIHCLNVGFPLPRILLSPSSACRALCENRVRSCKSVSQRKLLVEMDTFSDWIRLGSLELRSSYCTSLLSRVRCATHMIYTRRHPRRRYLS